MEKRLKKAAITVAVVAGILILAAVLLGVLNALVGKGEWVLGWNDYRYDESGYEIGEGSIPSESVTRIELDWIDGEVEIVSCQDTFISISESADCILPESAIVRWKIADDGTLSIKYRKSAWFFALGSGNRQKKLTLRVPERFFDQLTAIDVDVDSTDVVVYDIVAPSFSFESSSGTLGVKDCVFASVSVDTKSGDVVTEGLTSNCVSIESMSGNVDMRAVLSPDQMQIDTESGDIKLRFPQDASFVLDWESKSGRISYDLPLTQADGKYILGGGNHLFEIRTESGDLSLITNK